MQSSARCVITFEPLTQSVKTGEQYALGNVRLVELVSQFPLQFCRDDDLVPEFGMNAQPIVQRRYRVGHDRKKCELVDNTIVNGGWLVKDDQQRRCKCVKFRERWYRLG